MTMSGGRAMPALLEHEDLGRVPELYLVLELLLELLEPVGALLDHRHLVALPIRLRARLAPTFPPPATITYI